ncbi:uncharacterized protein LOC133196493 [Saccostrea echinata]|uniref:uncharacterized protein LOC133196493 n=1 Tax=Saccostrea echinata TaxID=191078 RepID=UPI002A811DDF|nr:uncharacterized protein LOC133196493 [Saccostrea echinata]
MKKGQKKERKRFLLRSQENTQAVDYQHYFNDDENFTLQSFNTEGHPGTSSAYRFKESQDPSHDYADYDEIKDQKLEAKWRDEKGYSTAEFRSLNRPLPPIKAEENDYMSPGDELPLEQRNSSTSNDSSSPPGNGGYLSPLQEEKEAEERLVSNNSDSSSNKSEKSDKSRKYENEPSRDSSSQAVTPYEVIKTTDESKQHQYVKLRTSTS